MIGKFAAVVVPAFLLPMVLAGGVRAQGAANPPLAGAQSPGARAGNSYVPSTHTPGCGGALCDADDAQRLAGPPPPCQGLICGVSPYSMQPPVTAAEAARLQQERARAEAAAAAAPAPERPARHARHRSAKRVAPAKKTPAKAARTADPATTVPAAPAPSR